MSEPTASRPVRTGYVLVTGLLVLALVFGMVAISSVVVGLVRHGDSLLYGHKLMLPAQVSAEDVGHLPAGVRLVTWVNVRVDVAPTTKQMLLRSAMDLLPLVLLVGGLWLLRGFLRSVLGGDPFGADNVRRLRSIGLLLAVGGPILELINYSLRLSLFDTLPPYPSIHLAVEGFSLPGNWLLGGLGAFILAEVFAYGVQLREDVEATI